MDGADRDRLADAIARLLGRRCTGCVVGEGNGAPFLLELEPRAPRRRPLDDPALNPEQRTTEALYAVFVECPWRLVGAAPGACEDAARRGELRQLVGLPLTGSRLLEPGLDLELDLGPLTLHLFCSQAEGDGVDGYSLFQPDEILVVASGGQARREDRARPVAAPLDAEPPRRAPAISTRK
jgi:hypothetical protein